MYNTLLMNGLHEDVICVLYMQTAITKQLKLILEASVYFVTITTRCHCACTRWVCDPIVTLSPNTVG